MGGIHGKIAAIEDDTVLLDVDKGTKIKIEKSSISLEASKKYAEKK
jgi:preprotein translocase subunit YajC